MTGLISLLSKGLSRVFSNTTAQEHQFFSSQPSLWSISHTHTWLLVRTIAWTRWIFVSKVICLLFNMLCRFVLAFLPRSKYLLISWLRSLSIVIWEHRKIKFVTVPTFYPCFGHEVMGMDAMISVFLICLS